MSSIWKNDLPPPPGFTPQTWPQLRCSQNVQNFMIQPRLQTFPIRPALNTRTYNHIPKAMIPNNQMSRINPCIDPNHLRKSTRKAIADETLSLLRRGLYLLSDGTEIDIQEKFRSAVDGAICYPPDYYFIEVVEATFPKMLIEVMIQCIYSMIEI